MIVLVEDLKNFPLVYTTVVSRITLGRLKRESFTFSSKNERAKKPLKLKRARAKPSLSKNGPEKSRTNLRSIEKTLPSER